MDEGTSKSTNHHKPTTSNCLETQTNENDSISTISKEIKTYRLDINPSTSTTNMAEYGTNSLNNNYQSSCNHGIIQPSEFQTSFNLHSQFSFDISSKNQPQPLLLLALYKLNQSSLNLAVGLRTNILQLASLNSKLDNLRRLQTEPSELAPPDSLTSAPPAYSYVLQQIAARRRPRLMGTFIPSPSFVLHTPPPNYATTFDIYINNPIPAPPPRVYHFGFTPVPVVCPECGYTGVTMTTSKITLCTHLCALLLCLMCCWLCAPLPYMLKSCKDVYHHCRNCRIFLGMYCPSNPENALST